MAQTENSVTAYDVEDWKNKGKTQMSPAERESWLNEGQLLLTDYAEGIEREWELIKFYGQLLAAVADWCIVFLKGAHGPKWTDGQELNYKRRRIEYQQEEMIAHGFFIPPEFADLPPEMDVNYMRGRENIKKKCKSSVKTDFRKSGLSVCSRSCKFSRADPDGVHAHTTGRSDRKSRKAAGSG